MLGNKHFIPRGHLRSNPPGRGDFFIGMKGIIYKATNTYNGKVYIGQTVAGLPKRRAQHYKDAKSDSENIFHLALYQYPNGFTWEVLDEFSGDRDHIIHALNVAEEYQILKHRSNEENYGYNATAGGYSSDKFAEHIQRRQKSLGGTAKAMLQYGEDGEFIAEFPSLKAVAAHLGVQGGIQTDTITDGLHYGYQWRIKRNEYFPRRIDAYERMTRSAGKVAAYDADGCLVAVYDSESAARKAGIHSRIKDRIRDLTIREYQERPFYLFKCDTEPPPERISINVVRKEAGTRQSEDQRKSIAVYSADGSLIDVCESVRKTIEKYNCGGTSIRRWCSRKPPFSIYPGRATKYLFQIADGNEPDTVQVNIKKTRDKHKFKMEHRIIQYTLDGEFVKVWDNAYQAAESGADGAHLIRKCLTGEFKSPKLNYQWVFYTTDYPQNIGKFAPDNYGGRSASRRTRMDDTIEEVSYDGTVIATYRDTADAAEKSGFSQAYICNVLAGRIKHPKRRFRRK